MGNPAPTGLARCRLDGPKDLDERVLSISAEVLPGRETTLVTFVATDITERMQATKELIATKALIRSVARRACSMHTSSSPSVETILDVLLGEPATGADRP